MYMWFPDRLVYTVVLSQQITHQREHVISVAKEVVTFSKVHYLIFYTVNV